MATPITFNGAVPFSAFSRGGNPLVGDRIVGLRGNVNTIFNYTPAVTAAPNLTFDAVQANHGFTVGKVIAANSTANGYILADYDNDNTTNVIGIVNSVIDADTFELMLFGIYVSPTPLFIGQRYWLAGAGEMDIVPGGDGQVDKLLMIGITSTTGFWVNYVGFP